MDHFIPPHPRHDPRGGPSGRRQREPGTRFRAPIISACAAVCAAVLAVVLAAGLQAAPEAGAASAGLSAESLSAAGSSDFTGQAAGDSLDPDLAAEINGIIDANSQYQIGVALMDLSGGAVQQYGVEAEFVAASTAKVLAAEAYFHLVEIGRASLDDTLGAYSAEFQLQAMIQASNNDSWSLVMSAVGHQELSDYAASIGVDYQPETNTLTPAAMTRILAGLYSGALLNPDHTAQLLSYLQDTNYETLIPAAVPAGVEVFHKYGLLGGNLHDAAVLTQDGRAYALVIYTKGEDLSDLPERTAVFHAVAGAVADAQF
ncbi:serine hydrolase [Arthrobacter oryzae]|uniref:Serine hydrolase n=1 Tax=Arthrobacter oryzae TaxID=409290 RepID=A0A3N0C9U8_9MICC|nr:serine hydrolase [Arthrobacter oryzae]RNL60234.1 serine hydrolase [Arthrobacter oryzae]